MREKTFSVYIMGNARPTLYVGMTNNLLRRVMEHKSGRIEGFTKKYHVHRLLYYEFAESPMQAIIREKQIKNMKREDKLRLVREKNPLFTDLYSQVLGLYGMQDGDMLLK